VIRKLTNERDASSRIDPVSLFELALRIARAALIRREECVAAEAAFDAVVAHVLQKSTRLGRYERVREAPGTPHAIAKTLDALLMADVGPSEVIDEDPDLALIASQTRDEMQRRGLVSRAEVFARATEALRTGVMRTTHIAMLDVPISRGLEADFVHALARESGGCLITIAHGDAHTHRALAGGLSLPVHADREGTHLAHRLFGKGDAALETQTPMVSLASGTTESEECVALVRHILRALDEGTPIDRIGIVLHDVAQYRTPLLQALTRARLPFHLSRSARRIDPAGRAFLALLECKLAHLSARHFATYLAFGVLPITGDEGTPKMHPGGDAPEPESDEDEDVSKKRVVSGSALRAPRRWERLLVDAAVVGGGAARWERRLLGLRAELEAGLLGLEEESAELKRQRVRIAELDRLSTFAMPLIRLLDALPISGRVSDLLPQLEALARHALRDPRRVIDVLHQLAPLAANEVNSVDLSSLYRALLPRLSEITGQPPDVGGTISVLSSADVHGRVFDVVLVPGLVERGFPRRVIESPILRDKERAQISEALSTREDDADEERMAFVRIVQSAKQKLVASFPRRDAKNRERVPSFYLLELLAADRTDAPSIRQLLEESRSDNAPGWPAPRAMKDAIDTREADLSDIAQLLSRDAAQAAGGLADLRESSPTLDRALRQRWRRYGARWSVGDGLVAQDAETRALLSREALSLRAYSATALESFATCPYRFFLRAIMRLTPRETAEAIEELDPLTRGSLVHAMQFRVLQARIHGAPNETLSTVLEEAISEVSREAEDRLVPAIPSVFHEEIARIRKDLRGWLQRLDEAWKPLFAELAFGLPKGEENDAASVKAPVPLRVQERVMNLRGAIDLVEGTGEMMRATDHKTGISRTKPGLVIGGGEHLQPLLYALALEALQAQQSLPNAPSKVTGGRLYYCTERGGYASVDVALDEAGRAAIAKMIETIEASVASGFFPRTPRKDACTYCDYVRVCGAHAEQRAQLKASDKRTEKLTQLRSER
jgi:RecB family exonuclease